MVTVLALDGACEYSGESDNYNSKVLANTDNQSGSQETEDTSDSEYMLPNRILNTYQIGPGWADTG